MEFELTGINITESNIWIVSRIKVDCSLIIIYYLYLILIWIGQIRLLTTFFHGFTSQIQERRLIERTKCWGWAAPSSGSTIVKSFKEKLPNKKKMLHTFIKRYQFWRKKFVNKSCVQKELIKVFNKGGKQKLLTKIVMKSCEQTLITSRTE